MKLALEKIKIDGGTQARAALNEDVVAEYAEAIIAGADMPPVTVFHDGKAYWLADGFHRFHAHRKARAIEIDADVRTGTKRDAILHSVGANAHHGLRRSNEDKRLAVRTLLRDKEWGKWSDRQIADVCGVSHPFVASIRNPEKAAQQQAQRDASAARKVESDSTPAEQTAPQSHSPAASAPEAAQALPAGEHQRPAAEESHNGSGSEPVEGGKPADSAPADQQHADDLVPRAELDEALANARELADLLQGYEAAEQGEKETAAAIAKLHGQLRTVESQRDQYMTTCNELKKQVAALQRENNRLKAKTETHAA